jgi:hypothetical protein
VDPDNTPARIASFLTENRWVDRVASVSFLAAGEYNENYLVEASDRLVFRINHGTQLGLDRQIEYEFLVLQAVAESGCTPRPIRVVRSHRWFPNGALLMEYIPGQPLDYTRDSAAAARLLAAIHALPVRPGLIRQPDPIAAILGESAELIGRYGDHPLPELRPRLRKYFDEVEQIHSHNTGLFDDESLCIVNTELNSGNFLVDDGRVRLVDWEKAVVSYRYQDLGHFLVPTTTLWKDEYRFTPETRSEFLREYWKAADGVPSFDELESRTAIMERVILLRAYSWCYMAYAEYTRGKTLSDSVTLRKIKYYFAQMEHLLGV